MNTKMIAEIKKHMKHKTTDELLSIWIKNDREELSNDAFEAVKLILLERGENLPQQEEERKVSVKQRNHFSTISLVSAVIGLFILGSEPPKYFLSGMIGILTLTAGIIGVIKAKKLHRGRGLAIAGIVIGAGVVLTGFLMPVLANVHEKAHAIRAENLQGKASPPFKLITLNGASLTDADLRGSVYILDFLPRPEYFSKLEGLHKKYKNDGLKVFAVVPQRHREEVTQFVRANRFETPVLTESDNGVVAKAFFTTYGRHRTILVGRDGIIVKAFSKPSYEEELEEAVKTTLAAWEDQKRGHSDF